jgi:nicotinate-nucleotide adenylyltransferase
VALIGLLPGTFDPIHRGHIALAQAAREAGGLDVVWVLVDANPAQKANVLPYEQRFAMAKLATVNVAGVTAAAVPERWRRLPHTMTGFAQLMRRRPRDRFVFIVGIDTIARLDTWEDHERVVKLAAFLVAHRPEVSVEAIEALKGRLGPLGSWLDARLFEFDDYSEASSTAVRRELAAGQRPAALAPAVDQYIREHGLYR